VPELPMFPLGTVLFPHMVLPLHVFEPRYRVLMHDILAGQGEFGVALIERGHEVGGGDARSNVGTVAKLVQSEELDDGRWLAIAVGTRRFVVDAWLDDDPYPRATVTMLEDEHVAGDLGGWLDRVVPRIRRVLALQSELGDPGMESTFDLADDPEVACWQCAVLAPLNPFDAQQVLATNRCDTRMEQLEQLLIGLEEAMVFRLHDDEA
jgi:uncharacterized protein